MLLNIPGEPCCAVFYHLTESFFYEKFKVLYDKKTDAGYVPANFHFYWASMF